ncbi:hypothetical protein [Salaquimonas pukyongi]|uniref:hypothetical protein n=1 Tax=Salaquimonas pukyongi TaxID=2712698 RepID=UPI00096BBF4A|nr:hypothetical protein [Salaquimonas pukyongi]
MKKSARGNGSKPSMVVNNTEILLPDIVEAERLAGAAEPKDAEMARHYAEMMEQIYLDAGELDLENCAPDRRYFKRGKEAWVYEHGNIAELVFVR